MMDPNNKKSSFFAPYSSKDPSMEVPVSANQTGGLVSPYLNFNPAYIGQGSDYILPEGSKPNRGRLEMAFTKIGASILFGAGVGGLMGATSGLKEIQSSGFTVGKGDQVFNLVKKRGGAFAQMTGVIVLTYSFFGIIFSYALDTNNEVNDLLSGTVTGILYTSPGGVKKMVKGGVTGLAISSLFCLFQNKDRIKSMLSR
ncbi:hypothetical protein LOTGIDRAFT_229117 [Lottia gigantea]|uniref:Mitochondrial import inner membrane translocase subunit TIM23 n=1 Tax=Lottia gigantea TaxID=225164 RepID=V4A2R0_LOTGI|nr:hypothetical protein LOTGIDRAFT_229117 [Lottia gigantea]ESO89225.1 hypothetical protein LOTGIDRAFT_229117 [Lottia gigantea]